MSDQRYNVVAFISILVFAAIASGFVASLFQSTAGEIAQALGSLLGTAVGVIGAFVVAFWSFNKSKEQTDQKRTYLRSRIEIDLFSIYSHTVAGPLSRLTYLKLADGRLSPNFFASLNEIHIATIREPGFDSSLFDVLSMQSLDVLARSLEKLNEIIVEAKKSSSISDQLQTKYFVQLRSVHSLLIHSLVNFSGNREHATAEKLRALRIGDVQPKPGKSYEGTNYEWMQNELRAFARRHEEESQD